MPDKKREEFFTKEFLDYYNRNTGRQYQILYRPEDDNKKTGTYDFLCKNKNSKDDFIAIEEKSLNKSTKNVRDNKGIREIMTEVQRILDDRGLLYNNTYRFYLEFKKAPRKKERTEYVGKIIETVEQAIGENVKADIRNQVIFDVSGLSAFKRISLFETQTNKKIVFGFAPESNVSRDVDADTLGALLKVIKNSNSKLKTPKEEGKKTILLITNDWDNFILADEHNIRDSMQSIDKQSHKNIDEIYFIKKQNFGDGFDFHRIK